MTWLAEELGDDERLVMVLGIAASAYGLYRWYWPLLRVTPLARSAPLRAMLGLSPVLCMLILLPALSSLAAVEVRTDVRYILLFAFVGGGWLMALDMLMPWLGLHPREDAIERANPGAAAAAIGAQFGIMLIYTGANMGEGPTIWTTIGPAMLASFALAGVWALVELVARPSEAINIDRDTASGVRHGAMLIACGLVLARAVAGDWESTEGTWTDLIALGWPALAIGAGAAVVQILFRPTPQWHRPGAIITGLIPGAMYVAMAVAWVIAQGDWRSPVLE